MAVDLPTTANGKPTVASLERARQKRDAEADPRPVIRATANMHVAVDACTSALATDPIIYQRSGALVRVVHDAEPSERVAFAPGAPRLHPIQPALLRTRAATVARWEKFDGRASEWKHTRPDTAVVAAVHALGEWPGVRPIIGVLEAPTMRPDGSLVTAAGYDAATGYVLEPSADFPPIPDAPTREDARFALEQLEEPFAEFPWASDAARHAAVACALTLLVRPAIVGPVPGFVFDKNAPGTGGSLCADAVALIATGRQAPRMSWPPDEVELEKVLASYALRGSALICFDNIRSGQPFGGAPLDKVLTAGDTVDLRVLGKSEAPTLPWRSVVVATGNNVAVTGDTIRRVLLIRMQTNEERPQDRAGFQLPDLRAWLVDNRPRLVVAALTILRAFVVAGRPLPTDYRPWGSFEAWSSLIPTAIEWAGGADPMQTRIDNGDAEDPEHAAIATVLSQWERVAGVKGATLRSVLGVLYPSGKVPTDGPGDGFEDLREAIEVLAPAPRSGFAPELKKLGSNLRRYLKRVMGGRRMTLTLDRKGVGIWSVEVVS